MRRITLIAMGLLLTSLIGFSAMGSDGEYRRPVALALRVVVVSTITSKGEKARIRSNATKAKVAAVQAELAADPTFKRKLMARGVQIRNIIRLDRFSNGHVVVYVR